MWTLSVSLMVASCFLAGSLITPAEASAPGGSDVSSEAGGAVFTNLAEVPCGEIARGSRRFHSRIMGGSAIHITEFPHAVSLKKNGEHYCGGVLIHKRFVLTAAHCVHSYPNVDVWSVSVGDQNSRDRDDNEQTIAVDEIITHPQYKFPKFVYDLALVRLSSPVTWSQYAQPVCLPGNRSEGRTSRGGGGGGGGGRLGYLAGWGYDGESRKGGHPTESLHLARLPIMDNDQCEEWFHSQGKNIKLQPEHLCAGHEVGLEDGCQGDSGGGLVSVDSNQLVLVGIMSAGIGCGRERLPGVYTRVEMFLRWITSQVERRSERSVDYAVRDRRTDRSREEEEMKRRRRGSSRSRDRRSGSNRRRWRS